MHFVCMIAEVVYKRAKCTGYTQYMRAPYTHQCLFFHILEVELRRRSNSANTKRNEYFLLISLYIKWPKLSHYWINELSCSLYIYIYSMLMGTYSIDFQIKVNLAFPVWKKKKKSNFKVQLIRLYTLMIYIYWVIL